MVWSITHSMINTFVRVSFSNIHNHCKISLKQEEFLSASYNHTGIYVKCTFQIADQYQIAKVINQIRNYNPNEENNDDNLPWNELVQIVQAWEGNVGILGCHELNEFEFRIYPVKYYNPKPGNRSYKNTTDATTSDAMATDATTKMPLMQQVSSQDSVIGRYNLIFFRIKKNRVKLASYSIVRQ